MADFKCACGNTKHHARGLCLRCYCQRPEMKAYRKAYSKAYCQRPEMKARHLGRTDFLAKEREYQELLCYYGKKNGNIPRLKILRLEALSEYFGRDLEEWRLGADKKAHARRMG